MSEMTAGECLTELVRKWQRYQSVCARVASHGMPPEASAPDLVLLLDEVQEVLEAARGLKDVAAVECRVAGATWQQIASALRRERQVVWRKYKGAVRERVQTALDLEHPSTAS